MADNAPILVIVPPRTAAKQEAEEDWGPVGGPLYTCARPSPPSRRQFPGARRLRPRVFRPRSDLRASRPGAHVRCPSRPSGRASGHLPKSRKISIIFNTDRRSANRHRGKRGCPFQQRHRQQYVGQFRFEYRPRLRRADHGREPDDVRNRNQHLRASGGQLGSEPCRAETPADDAHRRCGGQRVDSANPNLPMPASAGQTKVAKKLTGLQVNRSAGHCPARACAARRSTGSS
jgi:hypothetical protein